MYVSWSVCLAPFSFVGQRGFPGEEHPQCAHKHFQGKEYVLGDAFQRMKENLFSEKFIPYKFYPRNVDFEPNAKDPRIYIRRIHIEKHVEIAYPDANYILSDESYSIEIERDGHAVIKILSTRGGLHAFNTLAQLFYAHSKTEGAVYTPYAAIFIDAWPSFEHRGLHLDISKNRVSPKDVKRTLEALSFNKFNRLHLHANGVQSWPLYVPAIPQLALKGAYHKSQIWEVKDPREVQEFGAYRGVEVYIEISLPGHTASIHHSYPSLIAAYNQQPWETWAANPPSGQMKLNSAAVPRFLNTLFQDLLPRISAYSSQSNIAAMKSTPKYVALTPQSNRPQNLLSGLFCKVSFPTSSLSQQCTHSLRSLGKNCFWSGS